MNCKGAKDNEPVMAPLFVIPVAPEQAKTDEIDCTHQLDMINRFYQKIDGMGTESTTRRINIAVTGHQDCGQFAACFQLTFLRHQAVHTRHANINQHAATPFWSVSLEKTLRIRKKGNPGWRSRILANPALPPSYSASVPDPERGEPRFLFTIADRARH